MATVTSRCEDYLKTIYKLQRERKVVRMKDLAAELGVRAPTAVGGVLPLKEEGLVRQERYGYLELTEAGAGLAEEIIERERLLGAFFRDVLGLDEDAALSNACAVEHCITPVCQERFTAFLRFLHVCSLPTPRWLQRYHEYLRTGEIVRCSCNHSDSCTCGDSSEIGHES